MTIKQLREILEAEWLPDEMILRDYDDNVIRDVNLVIAPDGSVSEVRLGMGKPD